VEFNPPRETFRWLEDVHLARFRLRASRELDGSTAHGRLSVFRGVILLAAIEFGIKVDCASAAAPEESSTQSTSASPYRRIFASYSHADLPIVEQFERYVETLGDRYVRDWKELRAGEVWNDRLMALIAEADVFQLFWSRRSMHSPFVQQEWQYALSLNRGPGFIRPTYWETPLPEAPEKDLPPEDLRRFHFTLLKTEARRRAARAAGWVRNLFLTLAGVAAALLLLVPVVAWNRHSRLEAHLAQVETLIEQDRLGEARSYLEQLRREEPRFARSPALEEKLARIAELMAPAAPLEPDEPETQIVERSFDGPAGTEDFRQTIQAARGAIDRTREQLQRNLAARSGSGERGRAARQSRWVLRMNAVSGREHLQQIEGLGAALAVPDEGQKWRLYPQPASDRSQSTLTDFANESRLYWLIEDRALAGELSAAVGYSAKPYVIVLLPKALEERMLAQELAYMNLEEDEIASTQFECISAGGGYDVKVVSQVPK
jgi:hypothetical protein